MHVPVSEGFNGVSDSDPRSWLQGPIIAAGRERDLEVWGTAFLIAEGWAMTARHVVIDYLETFGGIDVSGGLGGSGEWSFLIRISIIDPQGQVVVFGVTHIYYHEITDIALLRVKIQEERAWESLPEFPVLQLLPPVVGESISVVGCPHSSLDHEADVRVVRIAPCLSTGVVREVHEISRDRNLSFPCFHTSARLLGRMSGSPIFSSRGYICGVAVYSMQQDDDHEPISYGAALWPAAGIECNGEPALANDSATFFDVMRRGVIRTVDLDQVLVGRSGDGRAVINLQIAAKTGWTPEGNVTVRQI